MKKIYDSKSHFSKIYISLKINVCSVLKYLLIGIIFFVQPSKSFSQNVGNSDVIYSKTNNNSKDFVQKSKEFNLRFSAVEISNNNSNSQLLIQLDPYTKYSSFPAPDEFIPVTTEPVFSLKELQRNVKYPKILRKAKIQGRVILRVLLDKKGDILKVFCEMTDSDLLIQPAIDAVLKTKFTPAYQDKKPILYWISVPVNFKLR